MRFCTSLCALLLGACSVPRVASAPPGSYLVVLDKADATLRMIEPNSAHLRDTAPTGVGPHEAAAAPDGSLVVVCDYGDRTPGHTLTVFDPLERRVTATIDLAPYSRPHGIAFLDQRSTVLVTSETSKALLQVDLRSRKVTRVLPTQAETSHMLAVTPDKMRAFSANIRGNSVSVIDLASGELVRVIETGREPEAIAVTPDGSEVWVGHNADDKIVVLDARTLEKKCEFACGKTPIRIAFVPNGKLALVSCARSGELALVETEGKHEWKRLALPKRELTPEELAEAPEKQLELANPLPVGILCEPDGKYAFVACMGTDRIVVIDLATLAISNQIPTGKQPDGMAWLYRREGYGRGAR